MMITCISLRIAYLFSLGLVTFTSTTTHSVAQDTDLVPVEIGIKPLPKALGVLRPKIRLNGINSKRFKNLGKSCVF